MSDDSLEVIITNVLMKSIHQVSTSDNLVKNVCTQVNLELQKTIQEIIIAATAKIDTKALGESLTPQIEEVIKAAVAHSVDALAAQMILNANNMPNNLTNIKVMMELVRASRKKETNV